MRKRMDVINWFGVVCLIAGCWGSSFAAEFSADLPKDAAIELGKCKITALSAYAWRDWQPIVKHPGPDGGSPLYAKVKFQLDNSGTDTTKCSFRVLILDEKGNSYPVSFKPLPNFRVLPVAVSESYRQLDENGKREAIARYNVEWDGSLKSAESRQVEIITHDGPYLPAGSRIRVEVAWSDSLGHSGTVRTPEVGIVRTD